jgi:hypothetical protein
MVAFLILDHDGNSMNNDAARLERHLDYALRWIEFDRLVQFSAIR